MKSGAIIGILAIFVASNVYADATTEFNQAADAYIDQSYLPDNPTQAVLLGLHQYDNQLENLSQADRDRQIKQLKKYEKQFNALSTKGMDQETSANRQLVIYNIEDRLLMLEKIKPWENTPDYYSATATNGAFVLMNRNFAPATQRLKSLISREKLIPGLLADARKNLKNPPKIATEIALEQLPGIIDFFKQDVPLAFAEVKDETLNKEFKTTNQQVIDALIAYQTWLQTDLLPKSHGDFRVGKENFQKLLKYEEMVEMPLSKLLAIGRADLKKNQDEYNKILAEIAQGRSIETVKAEINADHPAPNKLLSSFSAKFSDLISFIQTHKIITIPSEVRPTMEETPPFMRASTVASMDTPGAFETNSKEAFFNVTLPNPQWDQAKINNFMSIFNYPDMSSIAIHEAYPGHYVQFLWIPQVKTRVRKIFGAASNAEGWAHYCEQMMLDEGYGKNLGEKQAKLLRLGQLHDALLRNARFVVGIEMHTGNMTYEQAIQFFMQEGHQSESSAILEAKRGTYNPTYLYYTLGKLEILKLRHDVEQKLGKDFNLMKFHNDFMRQGYPPIRIVREAMLGDKQEAL